MGETPTRGRLSAVAIGVLLVVTAVAVALVALQGVLRGRSMAADEQPAPRVTAPVRSGQLELLVTGRVRVTAESTIDWVLPQIPDGYRPVLTDVADPQERVEAGGVLAVLAGVPVFVLESDATLYRPLGPGDRGPDVAGLQQGLVDLGLLEEPATAGHYDGATGSAVARFYTERGFGDLPTVVGTESTVPLGQLAFLPSLPARVVSGPAVGSVLDPGAGLQLAGGRESLEVLVPASDLGSLDAGDPVRLGDQQIGVLGALPTAAGVATPAPGAGEGDADAEVPDVGGGPVETPAPESDGAEPQTVAVPLTVEADLPIENLSDQAVAVIAEASAQDALIVPVTALSGFEDTRGTVTTVQPPGSVAVTIGLCAAGECAVETDGSLAPGDEVVLGVDPADGP